MAYKFQIIYDWKLKFSGFISVTERFISAKFQQNLRWSPWEPRKYWVIWFGITRLMTLNYRKKISQMQWMTESIGKAKLWMSGCGRPSKVSNLAIKFFLLLGSFRSLAKLKGLSLLKPKETKGSRFESGCQLCAEVSSRQ